MYTTDHIGKVIPKGTKIYCVIRYKSGIHRVQTLVQGENGTFMYRFDGEIIQCRGNSVYCSLIYHEALQESIDMNKAELGKAEKARELADKKATNLRKFMGLSSG